MVPLLSQGTVDRIDYWISQIPDTKHGRLVEIDYVSFLGLLGNQVAKMFTGGVFGVFENVTPKRFSPGRFRGIFRNLRGSSQTFIHVLAYEGPEAFSDADVFIAHPSTGTALNLSPMYFWGLNNLASPSEDPDLYEFDSTAKENFSYKAVQLRDKKIIAESGNLQEIWKVLADMRIEDPRIPISEDLSLTIEGADGLISAI